MDLEDKFAASKALEGISIVLHCAGPFSATSQQMIVACLKNHCHYLDITGEISVFANAHRQSDEARHADIVLMPGVGFDVFVNEPAVGDFTIATINLTGLGAGTPGLVILNSQFFSTTELLDPTLLPGVPVPAAVWLFGSGLLGLVGVARRKTS